MRGLSNAKIREQGEYHEFLFFLSWHSCHSWIEMQVKGKMLPRFAAPPANHNDKPT
jgi:hypothetical protein